MKRLVVIFLFLNLFSKFLISDEWIIAPGKREFKFDNIKIVEIREAKAPCPNPDYILEFYSDNKLQARYRNIGVEMFYQSPDKSLFVGLSNCGYPGTAFVVLDNRGNLLREVKHGYLDFAEYCEYSLRIMKKWVNLKNPELKFYNGELDNVIQVTGCNGKNYNLMNQCIWIDKSFFYSKKNSLDNMYNNSINEDSFNKK